MKQFAIWALRAVHVLIRPLIIAWYSVFESHRVRVVVRSGDHFLLVRTSFSAQSLSLPGGGIERRETPLDAAARELHEETGIVLPKERFKLVGYMRTTAPSIPFHMTIFETEVSSKDLPTLAWPRTLEIIDRQWVPRVDLPLKNQVISWYVARR